MNFKNIKISEYQQFQNIDIDFHDKLTILTGANGSWKTTILNLLSRHFWWNIPLLSTPKKDILSKTWNWINWFFKERKSNNETKIWELIYDNNIEAILNIPNQNSAQYNININNQQWMNGFHIPSHRSVFRYQNLTQIPTSSFINKQQAFDKVSSSNRCRYFWGNDVPSSFHMKETLISWNIFWRWNEDMEPTEILLENYKWFETVLKKILPKTLWFEKFEVRNFEIILTCKSWNFIIDWASWWISALIDIAWQIYMYSTEEKTNFTVIIDEVENHLHPTMQRQILPDLLEAFPNVCFIVSTHSPLIVWSVQDSNIYVLKYNSDNKIISEKLDLINQAKTATEILDEVLGVSFTMPIWAENKLKEIVHKYSEKNMTKEEFINMRNELKEIWLERLMPNAISNLIDNKND